MTVKTFWTCSRCGSSDVEHVVHLWQNPNTEEFGDVAEGWNGESYCNQCLDTCMIEPEDREIEEPDPYPHTTTIRWGSSDYGEDMITENYRFATKAELDAFMTGVEVACGWLDHDVLEDSRER